MDIPVANTVEININHGTLIDDNSNNLIYTDVEPTQLTNQTASLETECIIILHPPQPRNRHFFITIPNSNSNIQMFNNIDRKIKIICLFFLFCYSNIFIVSLIILFNHPRQEE